MTGYSVDKPLDWISRCSDSACIEVARDDLEILMRDGKDIGGPVLRLTRDQWTSFQAAVAAGEFDRG